MASKAMPAVRALRSVSRSQHRSYLAACNKPKTIVRTFRISRGLEASPPFVCGNQHSALLPCSPGIPVQKSITIRALSLTSSSRLQDQPNAEPGSKTSAVVPRDAQFSISVSSARTDDTKPAPKPGAERVQQIGNARRRGFLGRYIATWRERRTNRVSESKVTRREGRKMREVLARVIAEWKATRGSLRIVYLSVAFIFLLFLVGFLAVAPMIGKVRNIFQMPKKAKEALRGFWTRRKEQWREKKDASKGFWARTRANGWRKETD